MTRIREDVHVHASAATLHGRIASLPADARVDTRMPLRRELAGLSAGETEPPVLVVLSEQAPAAADDVSEARRGAFQSLRWELQTEGPREVHVTVEASCRPAHGPLGSLLEALLEPWLFEPRRRQGLRDLLWFLKQSAERASRQQGS